VRERAKLLHGSLTYRTLVEARSAGLLSVIEHLDPPRLTAFESVLFGCARPRLCVLTTPECEYNVKVRGLPTGKMRHADHRFEWTRAQFAHGRKCAGRFNYAVRFSVISLKMSLSARQLRLAVFEHIMKITIPECRSLFSSDRPAPVSPLGAQALQADRVLSSDTSARSSRQRIEQDVTQDAFIRCLCRGKRLAGSD